MGNSYLAESEIVDLFLWSYQAPGPIVVYKVSDITMKNGLDLGTRWYDSHNKRDYMITYLGSNPYIGYDVINTTKDYIENLLIAKRTVEDYNEEKS